MAIHATAIVDAAARIGPEADIGPFCIVGAEVEIGARTRLMGHIYVEGPTVIGEDNVFFPYSTVGVASQDLKYKGERAETRIGHRNRIREFVTIHRGTEGGGRITSLGDGNLVMAYSHIAHDCRIGNGTVLSNGATLGGHVIVEDHARIGAFTGIHQFCRIGAHAMIGGYSVVTRDVLPYALVSEERDAKLYRANAVGLERSGFSAETINHLNKAFRFLRGGELNTQQAVERMRAEIPACPEIERLIGFIESSERGFIK